MINELNDQLQNIERELYDASGEYKDLALTAAGLRATYDVRYAQEYLKVTTNAGDKKMTVAATEALVIDIVQHDLSAARIAEAKADAAKRHLATLQSLLTSVQTRASLMKTELRLAPLTA